MMRPVVYLFALLLVMPACFCGCNQASQGITGKWEEQGTDGSVMNFTEDGRMVEDSSGDEVGTYELLPDDRIEMVLVEDGMQMSLSCEYSLTANRLEISVLTLIGPDGKSHEIPASLKEINYSRLK